MMSAFSLKMSPAHFYQQRPRIIQPKEQISKVENSSVAAAGIRTKELQLLMTLWSAEQISACHVILQKHCDLHLGCGGGTS